MTVYMCDTFKTLRLLENDSLFDESFNGYQVSSRDTLISTLVNYNLYSSKITHVTFRSFIDTENFANYNLKFIIHKSQVFYSDFLN